MVRKLENWITDFGRLFGELGSPELFRKWAAISAVAGVLERKVWIDVGQGPLYPNLYVILVAPPGIGKTALTSQVARFWNSLSDGTDAGLHVAPSSMTAAAVVDALNGAARKFYSPDSPLEPMKFNTLNICSNELGTLLPAYDPDMMNRLTDIYDGEPYWETRRTREISIKIEKPQLNFLAATTPAHLSNSLPEGAWDQGFLSRTMMIFNSQRLIRPLFSKPADADLLRKQLTSDLAHIFKMNGEFKFEDDAARDINAWHMSGGEPAPDHPRLVNYNTRRTSHLLKLCMVASAADTDSKVITMAHFLRALYWLLEAEDLMPDIFKALVVNASGKAMDECWHYAYKIFMQEQRPVAEARLVNFLAERVPTQQVMQMLTVMCNAKILEKELAEGVGNAYRPKARRR